MACGGDQEPIEDEVVEVLEVTPERADNARLIFQTVPSPLETASIFQNAGADYNADILNPMENVDDYSTNYQKAINFGIYGADLSYANIFDQTQESMFYMNCTKKLADGLGISNAFDAATMERLEENLNNRDSLMTIINDAFWIADAFLKENGQDNLSALIIIGGWIEGLYIGTQTLDKENPDEGLMKKIAEQKFSLNSLFELISTYEDSEAEKMAGKMGMLKAIYNKVEEVESETTVNSNDGVATIGGGSTLTYEKEIIFEIAAEIEKIRNEIIQ
jgi:hypothetical protein